MPAVESLDYASASPALRAEIDALMARAYGPSDDSGSPLHRAELQARSFLVRLDGTLAGYAGVVRLTITAAGAAWTAAGLSSVATDPASQRRGVASLLVAEATRFIEASGVDLGVFTCQPELVPLYASAGWQTAPDVTLLGSREPGALRSDTLGVVVLMRLFAARAEAAAERLSLGTIELGLPVGEFI